MWRSFSPEIDGWADQCANGLLDENAFDLDGQAVGGGTSAVPIIMRQSNRRAHAKPARVGGDGTAVACEKIASDLAFRLGLPLAPVLLSRQTDGKAIQLPGIVALSFHTFAQPRSWNGDFNTIPPDHHARVRKALSAIYVFHAWIDDHDHNWSENNALIEVGANQTSLVFFDYSYSLIHEWKPPAAAPVRPWATPPQPYAPLEMDAVNAVLERINELRVDDLGAIIGRIPPDCLAPDLRDRLPQALDDRRRALRQLLNLAGAP